MLTKGDLSLAVFVAVGVQNDRLQNSVVLPKSRDQSPCTFLAPSPPPPPCSSNILDHPSKAIKGGGGGGLVFVLTYD